MELNRHKDFLNENINLKDVNNIFWIPTEAASYLTKGYGELLGEEAQKYLTSIQDDMIKEGYNAGLKYCKQQCINNAADTVHMANEFNKLDEKDISILKELYPDNYDDMSTNDNHPYADGGLYLSGGVSKYYENNDKYKTLILDNIGQGDRDDMPTLGNKEPEAFKYFKRFNGHGGYSVYEALSLDDINKDNIDYYIEEGEFFYFMEDIVRKYYYLGALQAQQQLKEDWLNKGLELMNLDTNHYVVKIWFRSLRSLAYKTEIKNISKLIIKKIDITNKLEFF